jgi:2-polyprenyl-3-methyl-5-hydroxy-6-metoxy-1,4-benzoquinol methylase
MVNVEMKYSFKTCKICDSSIRTLKEKTVDGLTLAKCNNCNLLFVKDIPVSKLWAVDDKEKTNNYYSHVATDKSKFVYALEQICKLLPDLDGQDYSKYKILDIGCGDGVFLSMCKDLGFSVYGVELRKSCVDLCHDNGIENVFRKDISEIDEQFDIVTLFDVAEHLEELPPFFMLINKLLKRNGFVYIETPKQSVLDLYIKLLSYFTSIKNNRVSREHVQLFSIDSLKKLLSKTSFMPLKTISKCSLSWKDKKKYIRNLGVKSELLVSLLDAISKVFISLGILGNNKAIIIAMPQPNEEQNGL